MTTRVAIYARCSDTKQAEKELSIPAQVDACRAEAARQGWVVVREFMDEGISGRTDHRPAFQDMIAAAKETPRAFDVILMWELSRFARNREHASFYKNLLRKRGVTIASLHERVEDSAQGRLMEGFIEAMDQYYSENLAQDTKRGMIRKVKQGEWVGGSIPYGYRVLRPEGRQREAKMVLNEAEAPLVRRIFADAARGVGAATIARVLNREGVTTRKGRKWTNDVVLYLLRNRAYLGELRWGKADDGSGDPAVLVPNAHEALVDAETFERIEGLIAERVVEKVSPRRLGGDYLLSGLLRCGHCGYAFIGHSAKSGKVHYYGCQTKMKSGADQCPAVLLNRDAMEAAVVEHLKDHVLTVTNLRALLDEVNAGLGDATGELVEARTAKRGLLDQQRQQLTRLVIIVTLSDGAPCGGSHGR
ncbi:MAG TPA: recombinase family protein, partial [Myxococcota bacterium]|nr:recombinase family protein [Myxococcota bacterium]